MRASDRIAPGLALGLALAAGCSPNVLVVIGTDLCADGGTVGCVPPLPLDGLVGYWRLDEPAGSTIAEDSPGRLNNGTLVDLDPATVWIAGRAGGGLAVDAAGFVNVEPSLSIDSITDQVTISGWAYLEGTLVDYGTVASRQVATTLDQHYHISIDSRDEVPILFIMTENGGAIPRASIPVARQTWVHIAGTYDGSVARLYVDGREVSSRPITGRFRPDTTPFILGANGNNTAVSERFPGNIDEIMLYRRALSADEIAQLHDGALFLTRIADAAVGN